MSVLQPQSVMAGACFQWPITELGLSRSMLSGFSGCSSACTDATNTQAAVSAWRFVSAWWSSTAGAYGLSSLHPDEDPPSASPFPSAPETSQQADSEDPGTVLLVEDNATDIFVITEVLESCGLNLRLRISRDGREALRYLQDLEEDHSSKCPVLVLMDLNVPKVEGIEVLRQLRHGSRCKRTPVIVVTSSDAERDRAAARGLGAEAYFQKPATLTAYMELAQLIKSVLHFPK